MVDCRVGKQTTTCRSLAHDHESRHFRRVVASSLTAPCASLRTTSRQFVDSRPRGGSHTASSPAARGPAEHTRTLLYTSRRPHTTHGTRGRPQVGLERHGQQQQQQRTHTAWKTGRHLDIVFGKRCQHRVRVFLVTQRLSHGDDWLSRLLFRGIWLEWRQRGRRNCQTSLDVVAIASLLSLDDLDKGKPQVGNVRKSSSSRRRCVRDYWR